MSARSRWTIAFALLFASASNEASAEQKNRAAIEAPIDARLLDRIQGQISDLPWSIVLVEPKRDAEPDLMGRARHLAEVTGVLVVVHVVSRRDGGLDLYLADPEHARIFRRRIPGSGSGRANRSATVEAAALVVRSTLRALAEGAELDWDEIPPDSAPSDVPLWPAPKRAIESSAATETIEATPNTTAPAPSPAEPSRIALSGGIGWTSVWPGGGAPILDGPELRGSVLIDRIDLGVALMTTFPRTLEDTKTAVDLTESSGSVTLGAILVDAADVTLEAALRGGLVAFHRRTSALGADVSPTPARLLWSGGLGAEARAAWFPELGGGAFGLLLVGGGEALTAPLTLAYQSGAARIERNRLSTVQPRLALFLLLRSL
jgi:hypothetical protein